MNEFGFCRPYLTMAELHVFVLFFFFFETEKASTNTIECFRFIRENFQCLMIHGCGIMELMCTWVCLENTDHTIITVIACLIVEKSSTVIYENESWCVSLKDIRIKF